jgi:hypothetical protein
MMVGHSGRGKSCPMPGKLTSFASGMAAAIARPPSILDRVILSVQHESWQPHAGEVESAIAAGEDGRARVDAPRSNMRRPTSRSHVASRG